MPARALLLLAAALSMSAVANATARDLCADRPGKASPPCIVDKGVLQVETALGDWSHDRTDVLSSNSVAIASTELRYGITGTAEISLAWSPFTSVTTRDRQFHRRGHVSGIGDMTLALCQSLAKPDGSGVSLAVEPFVTLPTGHSDIGAGAVAAGLLLPFAAPLGAGFALTTTAQANWTPNAAGNGHHMVWSGVIAISHPLGPLQLGTEIFAGREKEPAGATTLASADLTLAWTPGTHRNTQFDAGLYAGLNADTPDIEVYVGVVRRF